MVPGIGVVCGCLRVVEELKSPCGGKGVMGQATVTVDKQVTLHDRQGQTLYSTSTGEQTGETVSCNSTSEGLGSATSHAFKFLL